MFVIKRVTLFLEHMYFSKHAKIKEGAIGHVVASYTVRINMLNPKFLFELGIAKTLRVSKFRVSGRVL